MPTANEIRQQFIDFFVQKHGHTFVPSSPVVPHDDPTLLFTNAGMNQFKDIFLGTGTRPYKRAANTQKCIRAGGKHNDLDDVGKDTYHHTFFEMLGNWSFGDYFKKEAIAWAWELLTEVWGLDKSRLHATVFEGSENEGVPRDDEALEYWKTVTDIDHSHIHWGNKKDNFWEMGDTGPCGPCSEIHIDRTADKTGGPLVNKGSADVIEIWNLVFIQFNRNADRTLTPLPAKHVDTGMGFERVTAILQGKSSNYDTDVFMPIFDAIQKITGAPEYTGKLDDLKDTAYRVIADHVRALTFALTDGAQPSNEGRGYVLRRILRRTERYGRQVLGTTKPFLCDLAPTIVRVMSGAFPELEKNLARVIDCIREEEESFIRTLDRGIKLFKEAAGRAEKEGRKLVSGEDAFQLHDTYGVYIDITEQMAGEAGLSVDRARFETLLEEAKEKARGARKRFEVTTVHGDLPSTDDSLKYKGLGAKAKIVGWMKDNLVGTSGKLASGDQVALLLDKTNFYAEQGGQVGDKGWIRSKTGTFEVDDTQRLGDAILHVGKVYEGTIKVGQPATLEVSGIRADTMRNHTATHLLNWALRKVLGEHVEQKGSLVDAQKTRFDFAHDIPLTSEQIGEIERLVNEKIYADLPVTPIEMPLVEAKQIAGVRAVFGEKYPDPVRVLLIGAKKPADVTIDNSVEFCGGTHLTHTGEAGFFKIVSQELVSKGVRRVTAVTGKEAVTTVQKIASVVDDLTTRFRCRPEEIAARIDSLQEEIKKLQIQVKKGAATDMGSAADKLLASAKQVNGAQVIVGEMPAGPDEQIRNQIDRIKQKAGSAVVVVGWKDDGKVGLIAAVTDDLVQKGVHAGKLVGQIAKVVGGGGGGRPNMAQAGGKEPGKLGEALELAQKIAGEQLGE
ncbi:MAG: alanine--tRNA ligase [Planctomycetes bacterium]|nr:alanine--tRNA ligase [Planctomycetota bacterium]